MRNVIASSASYMQLCMVLVLGIFCLYYLLEPRITEKTKEKVMKYREPVFMGILLVLGLTIILSILNNALPKK